MRRTIDNAGRVAGPAAVRDVENEIFARMAVHDRPAAGRLPMLQAAVRDVIAGGRPYDAHIGELARAAGAAAVVTDNRRHFLSALRYGICVQAPAEYLGGLKRKR
jgi:hypothetical protein